MIQVVIWILICSLDASSTAAFDKQRSWLTITPLQYITLVW